MDTFLNVRSDINPPKTDNTVRKHFWLYETLSLSRSFKDNMRVLWTCNKEYQEHYFLVRKKTTIFIHSLSVPLKYFLKRTVAFYWSACILFAHFYCSGCFTFVRYRWVGWGLVMLSVAMDGKEFFWSILLINLKSPLYCVSKLIFKKPASK